VTRWSDFLKKSTFQGTRRSFLIGLYDWIDRGEARGRGRSYGGRGGPCVGRALSVQAVTGSEPPAQKASTPAAPPADAGLIPSISLPKGGGAIHGIGEKFGANPVTGTASMTIPVATSPSRFGPTLALSYDSGAGNGPFGLGWNLSASSITRRTDKGLPQYRDADESDVFILSDAEDLVPTLTMQGSDWVHDSLPPAAYAGVVYTVERYRPRIEGLFARIERWTNPDDRTSFWRTISKENITSLYGLDSDGRIADPADPSRIFKWLLQQSQDDNGNVVA
jgi:hypothetical protein